MSNQIRAIFEDKLTSYISANLSGVAVHKGVTDDERVLPIVIIHAADAMRPGSFGAGNEGNYKVTVKAYIYTSADDETLQSHRDRVTTVTALLNDLSAVQALWSNLETDGKLYSLWYESDNEAMAGRKYGTLLTFTAFACLPVAP